MQARRTPHDVTSMSGLNIGKQYDELAEWWASYHQNSEYGVAALKRALSFASSGGRALDVGCGAGGRLAKLLEQQGFALTGLDASEKMIALARKAHPQGDFTAINIQDWSAKGSFNFILAWDSLFHLPLDQQEPVLTKLCDALTEGGVLLHSFGDAVGMHMDKWRDQIFQYSSIGVTRNLEILTSNGLVLRHLELDQFPEKHVYAIAQKL